MKRGFVVPEQLGKEPDQTFGKLDVRIIEHVKTIVRAQQNSGVQKTLTRLVLNRLAGRVVGGCVTIPVKKRPHILL
jgi:hypothetical protein